MYHFWKIFSTTDSGDGLCAAIAFVLYPQSDAQEKLNSTRIELQRLSSSVLSLYMCSNVGG